jgi:beta-phosphoglucomutase-like phosphatase (HAD superfamily)
MRAISELSLDEFQAAAFDWDGTMVDSMESYRRTDQRFVKQTYGVDDDLSKFIDTFESLHNDYQGSNFYVDYFTYLDQTYGNGDKSPEILSTEYSAVAREIQQTIEYKPNIEHIMSKIKENHTLRLALTTGSERPDIDHITASLVSNGKANLLEMFDLILTSENCKRRKPHPEIYQKVISHFAINKSGLIVFEDSYSGVLSAKKAGATVVNMVDAFYSSEQAKIDEVCDFQIHDWQELEEIVLK